MEVEHLVGLGIMVLVACLSAWLVWTCLCKSSGGGDDVESQQGDDEEVKSVNSRTKVISRQYPGENLQPERKGSKQERDAQYTPNPREVFIKPKTKNKTSCYVQSSNSLADPFGEWTRKEKAIDDTEALSGIKVYRKSPVLPHRS